MGLFTRRTKPPKPVISPRETNCPFLYERPYQIPLLLVLLAAVIMNTAMFAYSIVVTRSMIADTPFGDGIAYDAPTAYNTSVVFFFCAIPFVLWCSSVLDLLMRWRRTLSPVWILLTALAGLGLWILALGLWFPCTLGAGYYGLGTGSLPGWCPGGVDYQGVEIDEYFDLPFTGIGAVTVYFLYVLLSIFAFRARKNTRQASWKLDAMEGGHIPEYTISTEDHADLDPVNELPSPVTRPVEMNTLESESESSRPPTYVSQDFKVSRTRVLDRPSRQSPRKGEKRG